MLCAGAISKTGSSANSAVPDCGRPSRYESQKRRDWNTFGQYLRNHRPPLILSRCSGAHVLEFLRYLDQFGKTKVHTVRCQFYGHPHPPAPCPCPLRQAWGSLDALIGRLRAAFEENGGQPEANPFGARAVRLYLREVRDSQAKARGIAYEKKRKKWASPPQQRHGLLPPPPATTAAAIAPSQPWADLNSVSGGLPLEYLHSHLMMPAGETGNHEEMIMAVSEARSSSCGMIPLSVLN